MMRETREQVDSFSAEVPFKVIFVILSYNCASLLPRAVDKIPSEFLKDTILTDDGSTDGSYEAARDLGITAFRHEPNRGYGGNLKEGLRHALKCGADYIVEIHGDGAQFDPQAVYRSLKYMKCDYDLILGSRFHVPGQAISDGMPLIRYLANRFLSFFDRLVLGFKLTEYHTGFRIYSRKLLEKVGYESDSDDYLFSFQIIAQAAYFDMKIIEVPVEADYRSEHTTIRLHRAFVYAMQTFWVLFQFIIAKKVGLHSTLFPKPRA